MVSGNIKISATGIALPDSILRNDDLIRLVNNYDSVRGGKSLSDWIMDHYGIGTRRWMKDGEVPSDYGARAAMAAIERANITTSDIDFLIVNTVFGDYSQPTTATAIQHKVGMRTGTFALEINMPCAGPIYAMVLAMQMIRSGKYKRGLLVGCDRMSSFVDHSDFRMATLFGDGAGACIVEASQGLGIEDFHLASKGEDMSNPALIIPGGKAAAPTISEAAPNKLLMNGKSVEAFIGSSFDDTILNLSKDNIDDLNKSIDHIVPHQASLRSIESNIARSGLPVSKLIMTLYEYGNTSSASIYITLDKLFSTNDMSDKRILILGVGGGLNWGGLIYKHP